ncbi:MAG: hypothetical protein QW594_02855, partial [Candidatus Woesearchaeota archaeon]
YGVTFPLSSCNVICTPLTGVQYQQGTHNCTCNLQWKPTQAQLLTLRYKTYSYPLSIMPDYEPPNVQFTASQKQGKLLVEYTITDSACPSCNAQCAGIKGIKAYFQGQTQALAQQTINTEQCSVSGKLNLSISGVGTQFLILEATDRMHKPASAPYHEGIAKQQVRYDTILPTITHLKVLDPEGQEITFMGEGTVRSNVVLRFTITDHTLQTITVKTSAVGPNEDIIQQPQSLYCSPVSSANTSTRQCDIPVTLATHSITLPVTAYDEFSSRTVNLTKTLTLDKSGPKVTSFTSSRVFEQKQYAGKNVTLLALITEEGAGIAKEDILLDATELGYNQLLPATECKKQSGTAWQCIWQFPIQATIAFPLVRIHPSSKDVVGNPISGQLQLQLFSDTSAPTHKNITIIGINQLGEFLYYQAGDILQITMQVRENAGIAKAVLNATALASTSSQLLLEGTCTKNTTTAVPGNTPGIAPGSVSGTVPGTVPGSVSGNFLDQGMLYTCTWQTPPIKGGYYKPELFFMIEDYGGNSLVYKKSIVVFGVIDDTPDNFIVLVGKPIPFGINRLTATILPNPPGYKISVPFALSTNSQTISVLKYEIDSCTFGNETKAFDDLFRQQRNPTPMPVPTFLPLTQSGAVNYAEFTLRQLKEEEAKLITDDELACKIKIWQKKGDYTFANPEIDELRVKLVFYNATITGVPADKITEKINEKKKNVLVKAKFIGDASAFLRKVEKICSIGNSLVSLWGTFSLVESIGLGVKAIPGVGQTIGSAIFDVGCYGYELAGQYLIMPLWYGSFDSGFGPENCGLKGQKGIAGSFDDTRLLDEDGVSTSIKKNIEKRRESLKPSSRYVGDNFAVWETDLWPGARWFCEFATCKWSTTFSDSLLVATGGNLAQASGLPAIDLGSFGSIDLRGENLRVNPKDSLLYSAASMCLPGIIYNIDKWRRIECQQIQCLKETAMRGGDISQCDELYKESICLAVAGEVTNTVGVLVLFRSFSDGVSAVAENLLPNALKMVVDKAVCQNDKVNEEKKWLVTVACDIPRAYYALLDSIDQIKGLGNVGGMFDTSFYDDSPCEGI